MKNKMKHLFGIMLTLAMVLGLISGLGMTAFAAEELTDTFTTNMGESEYTGNYCKVNGSNIDGSYDRTTIKLIDGSPITIETLNGEIIDEVVLTAAWNEYMFARGYLEPSVGTAHHSTGVITIDEINSTSVTFKYHQGYVGTYYIKQVEVHMHEPSVDITGVELNKTSTSLTVGEEETLTATVTPENATDQTVTWISDNTDVATVDETGKVTAVAVGSATITATATNGTDGTEDDKTATCKVTVEKGNSSVVTAPTANTLTYNGKPQELVTAGKAEGGEMQYTISKDATTAPVDGYKASLPTGTNAGTYYVWYKVSGDENHIDSEPACVKVTIEEEKKDEKEETDDKGEVDEKEETDKKDETGTSIETEVNIADGAPAVKVDNLNNELAVKLLTDEEKAEYEGGTPVQVYLDVKALDKASVPAADLTAIEKKISDDGYTYGECLDLSLWKKVGDSTAVQIHDTNGNPISVTIPIPDTLKNVPAGYTRTFSIVRVHHGAMSVLGEGTGNSITIMTDKFSSYFIIFKDVKNATDDKKQDSPKVDAPKKDTAKAPATGDKINIGMIVMLMIDCVMAGVYLTLRRRMEK